MDHIPEQFGPREFIIVTCSAGVFCGLMGTQSETSLELFDPAMLVFRLNEHGQMMGMQLTNPIIPTTRQTIHGSYVLYRRRDVISSFMDSVQEGYQSAMLAKRTGLAVPHNRITL